MGVLRPLIQRQVWKESAVDVLQDRHSVKAKLWKNQKRTSPRMRTQDHPSKEGCLGLTPGNLLPLPDVCPHAYSQPCTADPACPLSLPDHKGVHNFSWDCLNIIKLLLSTLLLVIGPSAHKGDSNIKLISVFSEQFWKAGKSHP